jgi:hypothetical protein
MQGISESKSEYSVQSAFKFVLRKGEPSLQFSVFNERAVWLAAVSRPYTQYTSILRIRTIELCGGIVHYGYGGKEYYYSTWFSNMACMACMACMAWL